MGKRTITRRRGRGSVYQTPSHRHKGAITFPPHDRKKAVVEELLHDPGHSAPVARVRYEDGSVGNLLACEGMYVNQTLNLGPTQNISLGNVLPLRAIPEGTSIYNIEGSPGDGGKYVRAGGTGATVVSHGAKTVISLPSGEFRSFNNECRAQVGVLAGGGRKDKPILKAGKKRHMNRSHSRVWPIVRGVAMNAVNHPHGSGRKQRVGGPSTVSRHAPPGRKVGRLSPAKKKRRR